MAGYRQFHTQFWKDEWVIELEPLERYLFSYLFTNDLSSISGIYKLPLRVIQNETGLDRDFILSTFEKFQQAGKLFYKDGVMWVVNMRKFHENVSPTTMTKVNQDVRGIPDCDVKTAYLYHANTGKFCTDTLSIPYQYPSLKESTTLKDKDKAEAEEGSTASPSEDGFGSEDFRVTLIYQQVTGHIAIPSTHRASVTDAIRSILVGRSDEDAVDFLKPFFSEWMRRKYAPSNTAWCTDWAVTGKIPPPKKQGPPPDPAEARRQAAIQKEYRT